MNPFKYPLVVEPLAPEDGIGFVAYAPDLPGCMSDGETPQEAVANAQDAIAVWIEAARDLGHAVPSPSAHLALAS
jgi:antitoxin HicB